MVIKTDGEPAIVPVREALAKLHGGIASPEQPPKGEHQSNGVAEEAGRTIRARLRVYKIQLENKVRREFDVNSSIIQWMARWAAMALSNFKVECGRCTAYERQRGKRCTVEVVPFGEKGLVQTAGRNRREEMIAKIQVA